MRRASCPMIRTFGPVIGPSGPMRGFWRQMEGSNGQMNRSSRHMRRGHICWHTVPVIADIHISFPAASKSPERIKKGSINGRAYRKTKGPPEVPDRPAQRWPGHTIDWPRRIAQQGKPSLHGNNHLSPFPARRIIFGPEEGNTVSQEPPLKPLRNPKADIEGNGLPRPQGHGRIGAIDHTGKIGAHPGT